VNNPAIRTCWPPWAPFLPSHGVSTAAGRPIANFTLALNYAISGGRPWSYHAFNLIVHALAGLTLFGIVRRTMAAKAWGSEAALVAALLWTLHPLQTEAVTYVVQRTESLMGLLYLLTLYCFIRYAENETLARSATAGDLRATAGRSKWAGFSCLACLLGMATKEVMVTAPLVVLLYDRTFISRTFAQSWGRRRAYYLALAATWLPLAVMVASTGWNRAGTAGYRAGAGVLGYGLTQIAAVAHYLWLCLWPHPLVFDYGAGLVVDPWDIVLPGLLIAALMAGTLTAIVRRSAWGFLGAWFFLTLAPSSSILPVATQTMAEHRMYLALAAPAVAAALGLRSLFGRWSLPAGLGLACVLGLATSGRNSLYASPEALWSDTARIRPENDRAHTNLGSLLLAGGRVAEAIAQFETALRIYPSDPIAHFDLGSALWQSNRDDEAINEYRKAVRIDPGLVEAHAGLAQVYLSAGRTPEAIEELESVVRLRPDDTETRNGLGNLLLQSGRQEEAISQYQAALGVNPAYLDARNNLGSALTAAGRYGEAIRQFQAALQIDPGVAAVHYNLGNALRRNGQIREAVAEFQTALRLQPDYPKARRALEQAGSEPDYSKRNE
jgi:tetratricopeptide (TPR) repeat protein